MRGRWQINNLSATSRVARADASLFYCARFSSRSRARVLRLLNIKHAEGTFSCTRRNVREAHQRHIHHHRCRHHQLRAARTKRSDGRPDSPAHVSAGWLAGARADYDRYNKFAYMYLYVCAQKHKNTLAPVERQRAFKRQSGGDFDCSLFERVRGCV